MKKVTTVLLLVTLILSVPGSAFAENNPLTKLGRGIANVLTSPIALGRGITDAYDKDGILAGVTVGALTGAFNVVKRILVGAYEVATFPAPIPSMYEPILTDPEYFMSGE